MRKNYSGRKVLLAVILVIAGISCQEKTPGHDHKPDVGAAASGKVTELPSVKAVAGLRIFTVELNGVVNYDSRNQSVISSRISGRIERLLVKYNYQPVKKGQLIMEIYSPELVAAQKEFVYLKTNGDEQMMIRARQRLQLLGVGASEIKQVMSAGKIYYRMPVYSNIDGYILDKNATSASDLVSIREGQYVTAGQPIFSVYRSGASVADFSLTDISSRYIKAGQKMLIRGSGTTNAFEPVTVGLIEPVYRNGTNFSLARIYLGSKPGFQPGQLLTATIAINVKEGSWLAKKAVLNLGSRTIVYKKTNTGYEPREIQKGVEMNGEVQVLTDISDWDIASSAAFFGDTESFIQTTQP